MNELLIANAPTEQIPRYVLIEEIKEFFSLFEEHIEHDAFFMRALGMSYFNRRGDTGELMTDDDKGTVYFVKHALPWKIKYSYSEDYGQELSVSVSPLPESGYNRIGFVMRGASIAKGLGVWDLMVFGDNGTGDPVIFRNNGQAERSTEAIINQLML